MQTKITDLTIAVLFGVGALLAYLFFLKQLNQFDCLISMLKLLLSSVTSHPGSPFLCISQTLRHHGCRLWKDAFSGSSLVRPNPSLVREAVRRGPQPSDGVSVALECHWLESLGFVL